MLRDQFGKRLKQLRKGKITQEKFAEAVGVSVSTVKRWEKAEDAPEFDRLEKIAEALNVEPWQLFIPPKEDKF